MGSKIEAKRADGARPACRCCRADRGRLGGEPSTGSRVLVKASAGGGGRGMRVVRAPAELRGGVASARREAAAAFGDGDRVRRAAARGRPAHRGPGPGRHARRRCGRWASGSARSSGGTRRSSRSAPSPASTRGLRERLARRPSRRRRPSATSAPGPSSSCVDGRRGFAFLEMNTRLQVEHPVTEWSTGSTSCGCRSRWPRERRCPTPRRRRHGHAVEVRLYAEDPARLPAAERDAAPLRGRPRRRRPGRTRGSRPGRSSAPHYDPMLAKVIAHGSIRAEAVRKLATRAGGAPGPRPTTNRDLLLTS